MDSFMNCLPNGKSLKSTTMSALYSFQGPSMMHSQLVMRQWFLVCESTSVVSSSAWLAVVLNVQTFKWIINEKNVLSAPQFPFT